MTNTLLFRRIIAKKGLKYCFLADKLGITTYGLQKKIDNLTEFKASEIAKLSELLDLTLNQREEIFFARASDEKSHSHKEGGETDA